MTSKIRLSAFAVLLTASLALTGCGSDEKKVTLPDGSNVKVEGDGKDVTITTDEGEITAGKGLPDGFPSDIPLIDAKIVSGTKGTGAFAYTVVMQSTGTPDEVMTAISDKLTGAGFKAGEGMDMTSVSTRPFTNDKYNVNVSAAQTGDGVVATYTVENAN